MTQKKVNLFDKYLMMTKLSFFLILGTSLFISSCDSQTSTSGSSGSTVAAKPVENSIVYFFFEIEKAENGLEKAKLTDTKTSAGFVKNGAIENKASNPGNLLISLLGKNGEVMEERIIEDPLNPLLEVYAEDGLSKNKLKLNKAQFSVRFNQKGEISTVKIEKITQNSKNTLLTLKL